MMTPGLWKWNCGNAARATPMFARPRSLVIVIGVTALTLAWIYLGGRDPQESPASESDLVPR